MKNFYSGFENSVKLLYQSLFLWLSVWRILIYIGILFLKNINCPKIPNLKKEKKNLWKSIEIALKYTKIEKKDLKLQSLRISNLKFMTKFVFIIFKSQNDLFSCFWKSSNFLKCWIEKNEYKIAKKTKKLLQLLCTFQNFGKKDLKFSKVVLIENPEIWFCQKLLGRILQIWRSWFRKIWILHKTFRKFSIEKSVDNLKIFQ